MRSAARFAALVEILTSWQPSAMPANKLLANYMATRRYMGSKDRAWISDAFWHIIRHYGRLQAIIESQQAQADDDTHHLLAYAWLLLQGSPITESYDNTPHSLPLPPWHGTLTIPATFSPHAYDFWPDWIVQAINQHYGQHAVSLKQALCAEAPVTIRANRLKTSAKNLQKKLATQGIVAQLGDYAPDALILPHRLPRKIADGEYEMQDEASQMIALATQAKPHMRVVDLCAGAGGKTLALAAMMHNKGHILACDIDLSRLRRLTARATRAGASIIQAHLLPPDATPPEEWQHKADMVLIDAPCSGSGTWRRAPDAIWRYQPQDIAHFNSIQTRLLENAMQWVAPNGRIIYATCSIFPEENQHIVEALQKKYPHIVWQPLPDGFESAIKKAHKPHHSCLQFLPSTHKTDGMYVASMCVAS